MTDIGQNLFIKIFLNNAIMKKKSSPQFRGALASMGYLDALGYAVRVLLFSWCKQTPEVVPSSCRGQQTRSTLFRRKLNKVPSMFISLERALAAYR
jgi:hypothetical protein